MWIYIKCRLGWNSLARQHKIQAKLQYCCKKTSLLFVTVNVQQTLAAAVKMELCSSLYWLVYGLSLILSVVVNKLERPNYRRGEELSWDEQN